MPFQAIENPYYKYIDAISGIWVDFARIDVGRLSELNKSSSFRTTGYLTVRMAAILERYLNEILVGVFDEINLVQPHFCDIRTSLLPYALGPELHSVRKCSHSKLWDSSFLLFERSVSSEPLQFSGEYIPLDGKTIRVSHFIHIWKVFGLDGDCLPSGRTRGFLEELAENRNFVAHGDKTPYSVGKEYSSSKLKNLVSQLDNVGDHVYASFDNYLSKKRYLRHT